MLDLPRYLLGVAEILLLAGFATLGASALRKLLLPTLQGAPAHLATAVLALALLVWVAELLGSFGLFAAGPYAFAVGLSGFTLWAFLPREARGWGVRQGAASSFSPRKRFRTALSPPWRKSQRRPDTPPRDRTRGPRAWSLRGTVRESSGTAYADTGTAQENSGTAQASSGVWPPVAGLLALAIAAAALVKFGIEVKPKLTTGMTGFDSTWYHGPFAAGFFQSGDTWNLHPIAPQFLAWFYPANAELFHAVGMLAFGRDLLSPLLNLGWFGGCLVACWCIGRPYRVAPWSLALGALALSLPVLADQAGEARNDIVGIFFLLAAVAIALNAVRVGCDERRSPEKKADDGFETRDPARAAGGSGHVGSATLTNAGAATTHHRRQGRRGLSGPLVVAGLAAGLAAGTKLNFLLPAAVLVLGFALIAPRGRRWGSLAAAGLAALAGGGYWYLRNLAHAGNPLPWFTDLGPLSLPGPDQELGGREGHSVLGYLLDGAVWGDWFLPGLREALTLLWPLALALALVGLLLAAIAAARPLRCSFARNNRAKEQRSEGDALLAVAGLTGLAAAIAWLIAPTSASGPEGMPRGFESGLRYLAPALVLGLSILPAALLPRVAWGGAPGKARRPLFRPPLSERLSLPLRKTQRRPGAPPRDRTRGLTAWRHPATGPAGRGHGPAAGPTGTRRRPAIAAILALLAAIAIGYPVQRHYLANRYADPSFAAPGLNAAFAWSRGISDARIATTGTRQYPLFGTDLSNRVQFVGERRPHGGFVAPAGCSQWRRLLDAGDYDYAIATRDRSEPNRPPYPPTARWTEGAQATPILRKPPTAVYQLTAPLPPSACP